MKPPTKLTMVDRAGALIRQADIGDAEGIARLKQLVWKDEQTRVVQIARALSDASHAATLALVGNFIVGFVDGFTTSMQGTGLRWEVDLLAVHPDFRSEGWGEKLVRASLEDGRRHSSIYARALIQLHNHSSQCVFVRCGFQPLEGIYSLYVSSHGLAAHWKPENNIQLQAINTFNYSGAWIEPPFTEDDLIYARSAQHLAGWNLVGAVISNHEQRMIQAAADYGFMFIGSYQWWRMDY